MTPPAAHIQLLRELLEEARAAASYGAVAQLTKQIADLAGFVAPPARRRRVPPEPKDSLVALRARLRATQEMRLQASERGSYVAAAGLLRLETTLLAEVTAADAARGEARPDLTDAELVAQISADLEGLPAAVRAGLASRLR